MRGQDTMNEEILLGYGVFTIADKPIGLTRGGGSFNVETEFREIEADGDYGPVKGRVTIDRQVAKLTVNALTAFSPDDFHKYYPGLEDKLGKVTSNLVIEEGDYMPVKWEGKTLEGEKVTIELDNALNMGNLELTLEDKDEVVPELEYTATYDATKRKEPAWSVRFGEAV